LESIGALQTRPATAQAAIRKALRADDQKIRDYELARAIQALDRRSYPTQAGIHTALDELD